MKITIKSKKATSKLNGNRTVNLKAAIAAKGKSSGKARKSKESAVKRVYKGITGRCVLLVSGEKGEAFRLADVSADGYATLTQNNVGLKYAGAKVDLLDGGKWDKQTRLEVGNYVASKGQRATVKALSLAQADKLASAKHKIERNGKEITLRTFGSTDKHYLASIETFKTGIRHFFQLETERIGKVNAKHYGALIS